MKEQTFISFLEDGNGKTIDFERWAYKRHSTVLRKVTELYNKWNSIYKEDLNKAEYLTIYATPNGVDQEKEPIIKVKLNELLA